MYIQIKKDQYNYTYYDTKHLEVKKDINVVYDKENGIKVYDILTEKEIIPTKAIINYEKFIKSQKRDIALLIFDNNVILINVPYYINQ